jgi:serine/threonine protein kinase
MGVVYRALDPAIGRTVAIKTIRLASIDDPRERAQQRERLFREAQSAGILSHPHIVTIYDVAEEGENAYIFMEFVDGPTFQQVLEHSEPLDPAFFISMLRQCASALDYAHRKGIVHRDIKPANIMLAEGTVAKIADFGIARVDSRQMTQAGVILGTPNYMSPEQFSGAAVTGRADQFSLAVIAYEVLTGEKPFIADSLATLMYRIIRDSATPPHRINASLGEPVDSVLDRAMAKHPADRYPSCVEFIEALAAACASKPGWRPLASGIVGTLPTLAGTGSSGAALQSSSELPTMAVEQGSDAPVGGRPDGPASTVPAPPVAPIELPPPVRSSRDYRETEEAHGHLARNLVLTALLTAAIGAGALYWLWKRPATAPPPAQMAVHEDSVPSAPDRPSPKGPPASKPAETTPRSTPPVVEAPGPGPRNETAPPAAPPSREPSSRETAASPATPRAPGPGDLIITINTTPAGARIVFDNDPSQTCKAPCNFTLGAGRHSVAATLDGYRQAMRIFDLPRDQNVNVNLERLQGTLNIRTEPPGATVTLNGQKATEVTPAALTLAPGKYKIELEREGYQRYVDEVTVRDQVIGRLEITLARNP